MEPLKVTVSIVPQKYFVQKIGGDKVEVFVMVLPGASPATYEPKPRQMIELTESRIYFAIGVPFEAVWLKKFNGVNPGMPIIKTQDGIEKIPIAHHLHDGNRDNDAKGKDSHEIRDPHIWLSPPLVMIQARNILDALLKVDPAHRAVYEKNYRAFIKELTNIDVKIKGLFAGNDEGAQFLAYHPAWGYFAEAYGLEQIAIESEGKEPRPKRLQNLIIYAKDRGVKAIFVQPQFSTKNADIIAKAIGGKVVFADPLAKDWAKNILEVGAKFKKALNLN
ncbi:MAG: zinc ABC transporter solute-binding protein [Desulfobacterales bacterium]|nr:zinc ABC transporter solute-binding protein [Desulfobacterales bacterium]